MNGLQDKHIAVTGARKGEEISQLIANMGGIAHIRPTQGTVLLDEQQVAPDLKRLLTEGADWLILTTGIGSQTLLERAEGLGLGEQLIEFMRQVKIAARGYKTRNFLKGLGIQPDVTDDDGSIRGLIRQFAGIPIRGKRFAVQLYGEPSPALQRWLTEEGAEYDKIMPYINTPPPEEELRAFIDEILAGRYDAVACTSALQVHHLFQAAERFGRLDELRARLNGPTLAAAVGKVTAEAMEEWEITRIVQPSNQRMGGMIVELNRYFAGINGQT